QFRQRIHQVLNDAFMEHDWAYWKPKLRAAAVPAGELRSLGEALTAPETRARQSATRTPHPKVGWIPNMRLPFTLTDTPAIDPVAAPAVGEHTLVALRQRLGYDDERIQTVKRSGALGSAVRE